MKVQRMPVALVGLAVMGMVHVADVSGEAELIIVSSAECGPCKMISKDKDTLERGLRDIDVTLVILDRENDLPAIKKLKLPPIEHYPTIILRDASGRVVMNTGGYGLAQDLIDRVKRTLQSCGHCRKRSRSHSHT